MATAFPASRRSGHRWWAVSCPERGGEAGFVEMLGGVRPLAAACGPRCTLSPVARAAPGGAVLSCWHCSGLQQVASGGACPGGPPGTALQVGTRGSPPAQVWAGLARTHACPKSPEAGGLHPWKAQLLYPVFWALGARGASWVLSQGHKASEPNRASAGNSLDCR